jgi:hypothetical protein
VQDVNPDGVDEKWLKLSRYESDGEKKNDGEGEMGGDMKEGFQRLEAGRRA